MASVSIRFAERDFMLDDRDGSDGVATLMQRGDYEAPLPMLLMASVVRNNSLFLDVGANNGLYSILAAVVSHDVKIIAFEPFPPALEQLRRNLALNVLDHRVEVREFALSDSAGPASFFLPDQGHGLLETSCSLEPEFKPFSTRMTVQKRRLDDVALPDRVGVIKADIEGHEYAFLEGARATITKDRPFIFIEVVNVPPAVEDRLTAFRRDLGLMNFRLRTDTAIHDPEVKFDPHAWNHALIPEERVDKFVDACKVHGVELVRPW